VIAEGTHSADSLKHGFRFHHMFTTGQKKNLHYQWDLHRLVRCKTTHSGTQILHLPSLVSFPSTPNYNPYTQTINRVSKQVLNCGQQLEVFVQGLVETSPFDCRTITDLSKGAISSETAVTTNKA
jgi:hypothetical protein